MTDLDNDPYMPALEMTVSEASKKYGSYIIVANDIASGGTRVGDSTWRMYHQDRMRALKEVATLDALLDLIMQKRE